jgi:protein gp37
VTVKPDVLAPVGSLTDLTELMEREGRIERVQHSVFYEMGLELKVIRDKRLYRVPRESRVNGRYSFETFDEYCDTRWELDQRQVNRLIAGAELVDKMRPMGLTLPVRERHVRPLLDRLQTDDERLVVWQEIMAEAPERVTTVSVEEHIARYVAARDKEFITLDEWQTAGASAQQTALTFSGHTKFNAQDGSEERSAQNIEWARWSWNPVTGCKHDCPYCYARDIAHRFYPMQFAPALWYKRLAAPTNTSLPDKAKTDVSFKNVFTCSMADLFGRWVPSAWIEAVLDQARQNDQWNFLFLTKFPKRLVDFAFPTNAWVGTTVDCQARVKSAEDAFAKVKATVKWLSVEPMIEPLQFKRLDLFQWVVIGGASPSTQTPQWRVPVTWWAPLYLQAKELGLQVYLKSNLYEPEHGYPGVPTAKVSVPAQFIYLTTKTRDDIERGEKA